MPIPDYPFITVDYEGENPSGLVYIGGLYSRPYLWLRITNPATDQAMIVPAAVDTGADQLTIPATDAETLGHHLKATSPRSVRTAKGLTEAYPHSAALEVLGVLPNGRANLSAVLYPLPETTIYLTVGQKACLIGQGAFFLSKCILNIDYPEKVFSIRLPDHS
jgi:hypothetical protein